MFTQTFDGRQLVGSGGVTEEFHRHWHWLIFSCRDNILGWNTHTFTHHCNNTKTILAGTVMKHFLCLLTQQNKHASIFMRSFVADRTWFYGSWFLKHTQSKRWRQYTITQLFRLAACFVYTGGKRKYPSARQSQKVMVCEPKPNTTRGSKGSFLVM